MGQNGPESGGSDRRPIGWDFRKISRNPPCAIECRTIRPVGDVEFDARRRVGAIDERHAERGAVVDSMVIYDLKSVSVARPSLINPRMVRYRTADFLKQLAVTESPPRAGMQDAQYLRLVYPRDGLPAPRGDRPATNTAAQGSQENHPFYFCPRPISAASTPALGLYGRLLLGASRRGFRRHPIATGRRKTSRG